MDVFEAIEKRRSTRKFAESEVDDATIRRLLNAAIRAPSAGNIQPWRFFVVRDRRIRMDLEAAAFGQRFVGQAPVVIVVCADLDAVLPYYGPRGRDLYAIQDTAAATENMMLAAVASGLGTCWVGAFDERAASRALSLPGRLRPVALVPVGVPATPPKGKKPRYPVDDVTTWL